MDSFYFLVDSLATERELKATVVEKQGRSEEEKKTLQWSRVAVSTTTAPPPNNSESEGERSNMIAPVEIIYTNIFLPTSVK